ncbi:hypothetical protein BH10PLA1_BH10PLA1_17180 [soil metagenome]
MTQTQYQNLVGQVRGSDKEVLLRAAGLCDGHSIVDPKAFIEAGLPATVVDHVTRTHKSDGSPKGTIFVSGQPVPELRGVYGLDLLRFLADALGVQYRSAIGRGFEAQNIQSALHQHFHPVPPTHKERTTP